MRYEAVLAGALLLGGCTKGLGVEARAVTTQKTGHVAAYLAVSDDGEPARGLSAEDFTVYEDERELSVTRTRQTLVDKTKVAAHHTLVLLDVSDAPDPIVKRELQDSLRFFVERVRKTQSVSVFVYDGIEGIRLLAEYSRGEKETRPFIPPIQPSKDTSRNLNGALVRAEEELTRRLERSGKALRFGNLVVFSNGPDLAGRVDGSTARIKLQNSKHRIFGVSWGEGASSVKSFSRDGYFEAFSPDVFSLAFEELAHHVEALYEQEYVLVYCSPARAGTRRLRIEARLADERGEARKGGVSSSFNADGFGGTCNPEAAPRFDVASMQ